MTKLIQDNDCQEVILSSLFYLHEGSVDKYFDENEFSIYLGDAMADLLAIIADRIDGESEEFRESLWKYDREQYLSRLDGHMAFCELCYQVMLHSNDRATVFKVI